ncbi:MAG: transcription antitermination factor NusB [Candidatus Berkelbacteria bacterium]|nr:transcription antitermination factor NusB [Candidatus Berkelbacteria bacterium]
MNRHQSRMVAMQIIYEWSVRPKEDILEIARVNIENNPIEDIDEPFITRLIKGVRKHYSEIDKLIEKAAPEWPLEQIAVIDIAILRLSIYELLFCSDIPPKVAIDEAVELAKTYGGANSSKFINGVLGTVYRSSDRYNKKDK